MEINQAEIDKIDEIHQAIKKNIKIKLLETIGTILLSIATVLSAWSVFQASQWNGRQSSPMKKWQWN
jgi:predicted negative regulator of RcsB-dependent stress response